MKERGCCSPSCPCRRVASIITGKAINDFGLTPGHENVRLSTGGFEVRASSEDPKIILSAPSGHDFDLTPMSAARLASILKFAVLSR